MGPARPTLDAAINIPVPRFGLLVSSVDTGLSDRYILASLCRCRPRHCLSGGQDPDCTSKFSISTRIDAVFSALCATIDHFIYNNRWSTDHSLANEAICSGFFAAEHVDPDKDVNTDVMINSKRNNSLFVRC
ncbi:hypothetical protein TcasGA2_TC013443 [Tribolium castaneum]|uniref:Uncharacterized protein n=1 Tax=Tribolium castaneum TaxID=7070 RepID=D6WLH4_TRICA|nr:hypothetical protein TcasGA2_TC013443 [Tribolium castaneum]